MQIQWFPGHMHKARLQIKAAQPKVDLFIELLDARIPYSSENPMLAELRGEKPVLKLLSKSDLADVSLLKRWQQYLNTQQNTKSKSISTANPASIHRIKDLCHEMLPAKKESGRPIMAMIVGIPNVGKSTLINTLAGKPVAKTGNEPAVTKGQQRINIGDGVSLMDTPGVMWPNVENPNSGSRLAAIGSIKDTAMDYAEVGFFLAKYLTTAYPDLLKERYGLEEISPNIIELMDAIGKKRGCLGKGGVVDWDRTSRILLTDFRSGKIGLVTLETPEMMVQEKKQVVITSAAKAEKKASRKEARRAKRKSDRAESKGKFKRRD
jgi:ribosome biogenesis GTPase A